MTSVRILALALALATQAVPVAAQDRDKAFFKQLDQNGDGGVDLEEYTLEKGAILYSLDKDRSLKLEPGETKLPPAKFRQYAGEDGLIDGGEMFEMPEIQFGAFDTNGDRTISAEEYRRQVTSLRKGSQTAEGR
jgi:hypothetical protein